MISDARERQPIGSEHPFRPWLQDSLSVCFGTVRVSANSHENPYYTYLQLLWDHHVNLSVISQKSLHEREVGKQGTSWKYSMTCRVLDSVLDSAATLTTSRWTERNAADSNIRATSDWRRAFRGGVRVGCFLEFIGRARRRKALRLDKNKVGSFLVGCLSALSPSLTAFSRELPCNEHLLLVSSI